MSTTLDNLSCVDDFEKLAKSKLTKSVAGYYSSGACGEFTLDLNIKAFQRLRIKPRILKDVSRIETTTTVLEHTINVPIGVAPTGMQKMAHPQGECANARAVGDFGSIFILSTLSNYSIEEVAEAAPNTIKWFQLYIYKDRISTINLIRRAEKAGFKALVLTVDANVFGIRYADIRNNFTLPDQIRLANFDGAESKMDSGFGSALTKYTKTLFDSTINWKDVKWLMKITKLPVILKGVQCPEDARIAADIGVPAIIVSNHGARQLDTAPASIEVLPEIVRTVGNKCEVYLDGGIRYGTDVFKAIAMGAKMVFVGRPAVWALACDGQRGVKNVLDILTHELIVAMGLAGCTSVDGIKRNMVVHQDYYSKF